MGLLDGLKGLFSGGKSGGNSGVESDGRAIYFYVQCNSCGEKIRVRIDTYNELAQEFDDNDKESGWTLDKDVMGNKCFKMMHLHADFDRNKKLVDKAIDKGSLITKEAYLQGQPVS
jgi:DNA-directed RNA polymerase subunit N (RpoN/RPB10)